MHISPALAAPVDRRLVPRGDCFTTYRVYRSESL